MTTFDTFEALDAMTRDAVVDLLYRLADDALIIGHRDSEWTGLAPILEEDIGTPLVSVDTMPTITLVRDVLHNIVVHMCSGRSAEGVDAAHVAEHPLADAFNVVVTNVIVMSIGAAVTPVITY